MIKKAFFKFLFFSIILVVLINIITPILILKTNHRGKLIEGLYNHTGNSYDVVLMGGSHMNSGIDPNILWKSYGITSFNYATGGQSIDVTYYMLKEVLKNHKVKIAVVDAYYLARSAKYGTKQYISNALDNMKFSLNKLDAINNCVPLKDRFSYLFPILKYHYRWNELTKRDFTYKSNEEYYQKGFDAGTKVYGKSDSTLNQTSSTVSRSTKLPEKSYIYLKKIIDLCNKNGVKLILFNTPFDYNSDSASDEWVHDQAPLFNTVSKIAHNNNIPFINYNDKIKQIGFDFKNEMYNSGHLNIKGSIKVSTDFSKYLNQNYNLKDHRGDPSYKNWYSEYKRSQTAKYLSSN